MNKRDSGAHWPAGNICSVLFRMGTPSAQKHNKAQYMCNKSRIMTFNIDIGSAVIDQNYILFHPLLSIHSYKIHSLNTLVL